MFKKNVDKKINKMVREIVKEYQPEKIILFGSYAWGKPNEDSDVDLFILKNTDKPRLERERELRKSLFSSDFPLDIIVYTPKEAEKSINENRNLFIEDIVRNGKILYKKEGGKIRIAHNRPLIVL